MLKLPILIVNFKTYEEATGEKAVELAKAIEKAAIETKKNVAVAVQAADIFRVSSQVKIPVLAEHLDPDLPGSHTGKILAEDIKGNGAVGTLLNHSEDRYRLDVLDATVDRAWKLGLTTIVCANNDEIAESISAFKPDMIAVEPPELIGGDVSISKAKPELITKSLKAVDGIPLLVGAGVKTSEDVKVAMKLGAKGILLASGITKAENPYLVTKELLKELK